MKVKKLAALALAAVMTVSLTACSTKNPTPSTTPSESSAPAESNAPAVSNAPADATTPADTEGKKGLYPGTLDADTVTINIVQEPVQMNSILTTDSVSGNVLRHTIENLTRLNADDEAVPGVAESWNVSDDNLSYTFHLREGMKWSNGEPVTAHDFVYAWTQLLTPESTAQYNYMGFVFKNGESFYNGKSKIEEVGFKAVDDKTLEVTLENPYPYFINMLSFYSFSPINQKAYESIGADNYAKDADTFVTNGPYKMESWTHDDSISLVKNEEYFNAANINIPKIKMRMINDSNTALNAFKAGELDMAELNADQRAMIEGEGQSILSYSNGSSWYFEYNIKTPGLNNTKIRKALTMAVDSESYINNVIKNDSTSAYCFTNPSVAGVNGNFADAVGKLVEFNAEEANKLLEEGLKEEGLTKETFKATIITDDTDAAARNTAYFQEQWKTNLGIKIDIQMMPFKSRIAKMNAKDFDIVFAGWSPDYNDAMTFLDLWVTNGGNNHTNWGSKTYDTLISGATKESDPVKRENMLIEAEKLLMDEMPVGPFYNQVRDYTCSDKLTGVVRSPFSDISLVGAAIVK